MNLPSEFLFTTCQAGAEPALKAEVSKIRPDLRFAFSRPGFVTFRQKEGKPLSDGLELDSVFARAYGLCLGKLEQGKEKEQVLCARSELGAAQVHLWQRDRFAPGEEPMGYDPREWERLWYQRLELGETDSAPAAGERVLDLIAVEENALWMGFHRHSLGHSPDPGGRPDLILPGGAPSRAFLKLEEAVRTFSVPFEKEEAVLEIGSAPGGMSYALLHRGLRVTGVDPGKMAKLSSGFRHLKKSYTALNEKDLAAGFEWLVIDMNVPPRVTLEALAELRSALARGLKGALLVLKLNHWRMAREVPKYLEEIKALGFSQVRARQLYHNRQEITVFAKSRLGSIKGRFE